MNSSTCGKYNASSRINGVVSAAEIEMHSAGFPVIRLISAGEDQEQQGHEGGERNREEQSRAVQHLRIDGDIGIAGADVCRWWFSLMVCSRRVTTGGVNVLTAGGTTISVFVGASRHYHHIAAPVSDFVSPSSVVILRSSERSSAAITRRLAKS